MEAESRLTKRETLPVTDMDGKVLGSCTISKFTRQTEKPYNEIILFDTDKQPVAEISGYRLHSRVRCGQRQGNSRRIDSKDAVAVARVALEYASDSARMLAAIRRTASTLASQRMAQRRRSHDHNDSR